jgi:hypothetical protein
LQERKLAAFHGVDPHRYGSYLTRLWRKAPCGPWRCQVCCVGTVDAPDAQGFLADFWFGLTP